MNKTDRRVRKTQRALQLALAELMIDKDLNNITVQELVDKADIHRATFYAHYHDIYDLYEQIENGVISELDVMVSSNPAHEYHHVYTTIVDYISDNPILLRMLLSNNRNQKFQNQICELLEKNYLNIWLFEDRKTEITEDMRLLTTYHIHGCMSVIAFWVNTNFSYPKYEITKLIQTINDHIEKIMM